MTALITGATGGLGRAFAKDLALRGHGLLLTAQKEEALSALAQEVRALGVPCETLCLDLSAPGAPGALLAFAAAQPAFPEILINNAGFGLFGPFAGQEEEALSRLIAVNITALTQLCRLFLPRYLAEGKGYILNVASTAAFSPGPYMAAYYASKAYVLSLSRALSRECAKTGVTVTALCPGPTETAFFSRAGTRRTSLYGKVKKQSPESVAKAGVNALLKGRITRVSGLANKGMAFATRLLPVRALSFFISATQEKPEKKP